MRVGKFTRDLELLLKHYREANTWYFRSLNKNIPYLIFVAWRIYHSIHSGRVNPIFLGDTEIRQAPEYIRAFGILAVNETPQEQETLGQIEDALTFRNARARDGVADAYGVGNAAVPVTRTGSILNEADWSPMLNDAMILGGVNRGIEFHFLPNDAESATLRRIQASVRKVRRLETGDGVLRSPNLPGRGAGHNNALTTVQWNRARQEAGEEVWWRFFCENENALWNTEFNCPRMFVRELFGLRLFGYRPIFDEDQLSFVGTNRVQGTFSQYCRSLRFTEFYNVNRKTETLRGVASYLFDDPSALDRIAT